MADTVKVVVKGGFDFDCKSHASTASVNDLQTWLVKTLATVPTQFKGAAMVEADVMTSDYYDSTSIDDVTLSLYYERPYTPEEIAIRKANEGRRNKEARGALERREREQYEKLKKKYGNE